MGGDLVPTTLVSLRIDNELLEYLRERAKAEHRSLSNMIISILVDERKRKNFKVADLFRQFTDDVKTLTEETSAQERKEGEVG